MADEPPAPPPAPAFLDEQIAVERIQAIVANARTVWFALVGFLAFIGLTLTSVRDLDFFSAIATTQLPIVNIAIPTTTFFWSAAWLAAVLHTYFHLYLLKLWDALAEAPPQIDGAPLGDRVFPWLVVDWGLRSRPDLPTTPRPMDWVASFVTWLVIWLATPILLFFFWQRSMPAHLAWLSLLIAAALFVSLYATLSGWLRAKERLSQPGLGPRDESASRQSLVLPATWRDRGAVVALILVLVSLARTQLETQVAIGPWRWSSLAPIDLVDAEIVRRPADWVGRDTAKRRFRITWCRDREIPADACENPTELYHITARETWCDARFALIEQCAAEFRRLESAFDREWQEQRREYLANLAKPDLRDRDLRGANAAGAFLAGIDLRGARLDRADLSEARLEGANLNSARLEGADLSSARLEGADLTLAGLKGANLVSARLEEVSLFRAQLQGANLMATHAAKANVSLSQLEGTNLVGAWLQSADWSHATIGALPAHGADLSEGRDLTQSKLAHVIGNDFTMLPIDAMTSEPLFVWTCWTDPPKALHKLLQHFDESEHAALRATWLCPPGVTPKRTGRPAEPAPAATDAD